MMRIRSMAEMPVRRVEISNKARNHTSNVVPLRLVRTRVEPQRAHAGLPPPARLDSVRPAVRLGAMCDAPAMGILA
jgi:hypothetical protein